MELNVRTGSDRFVENGAYRELEARLRLRAVELAEIPAVVVAAFDRSTRLLPFVYYDSHMFPPGAAAIAGVLFQAGFQRTRALYQLWTPNFRPSRARLDGRALQMLLVSSLQIHARSARALIGEAWRMRAERPLIIVGGPMAIYQPSAFWSMPGQEAAPDVVVTGESFVLLDLLAVLLDHRGRNETMRQAFERARHEGALERVPGLVYLAPGATLAEPVVVDTGLQRLVQDLDELPHEGTGLSLLEPPHRRASLSPTPIPQQRVGRYSVIASLLVTQGCKFKCAYCPIPAVQQRSWRYRSPEVLVEIIRTIHERFGVKYFFGADDNFFNRRETAEALLTGMARATTDGGRPFGERLRFATEATEIDTYKNRDLLPVGRAGGLHALWFGIEDLTASLVNKGQKPGVTIELFRLMRELKISPMAMIMFHDGQPLYTRGSLYGLYNQVEFLRSAGAVSLQVTAHTPALGTRELESMYASGRIIRKLGGHVVQDARIDGNHIVVASAGKSPWRRQLGLLGAYAAFYNPWNFLRALRRDGSPLRRRRIGYQAAGMVATLWTAAKLAPYIARLMTRRIEFATAPPRPDGVPARLVPGAAARYPQTPQQDQVTAS